MPAQQQQPQPAAATRGLPFTLRSTERWSTCCRSEMKQDIVLPKAAQLKGNNNQSTVTHTHRAHKERSGGGAGGSLPAAPPARRRGSAVLPCTSQGQPTQGIHPSHFCSSRDSQIPKALSALLTSPLDDFPLLRHIGSCCSLPAGDRFPNTPCSAVCVQTA